MSTQIAYTIKSNEILQQTLNNDDGTWSAPVPIASLSATVDNATLCISDKTLFVLWQHESISKLNAYEIQSGGTLEPHFIDFTDDHMPTAESGSPLAITCNGDYVCTAGNGGKISLYKLQQLGNPAHMIKPAYVGGDSWDGWTIHWLHVDPGKPSAYGAASDKEGNACLCLDYGQEEWGGLATLNFEVMASAFQNVSGLDNYAYVAATERDESQAYAIRRYEFKDTAIIGHPAYLDGGDAYQYNYIAVAASKSSIMSDTHFVYTAWSPTSKEESVPFIIPYQVDSNGWKRLQDDALMVNDMNNVERLVVDCDRKWLYLINNKTCYVTPIKEDGSVNANLTQISFPIGPLAIEKL